MLMFKFLLFNLMKKLKILIIKINEENKIK
jgi:hypothetical protein